MKICELLLPKSIKDSSLSSKAYKDIDTLQTRMNLYVDKIGKMATGKAKDFLKTKLQADYTALKDIIQKNSLAETTELSELSIKPVAGIKQTMLADTDSAAYTSLPALHPRYDMYEAVHKLPLVPEDFKLVKQLMKHPIPAIVARIYVSEVIDDDELNDQFRSLEDTQPNRDIRPLIVEWLRRVMPDQMHHFGQEVGSENQRKGVFSPLHGDDPHMYSGSTYTGTQSSGDAYGSY